jgi:hypothetical protein
MRHPALHPLHHPLPPGLLKRVPDVLPHVAPGPRLGRRARRHGAHHQPRIARVDAQVQLRRPSVARGQAREARAGGRHFRGVVARVRQLVQELVAGGIVVGLRGQAGGEGDVRHEGGQRLWGVRAEDGGDGGCDEGG